MHICTDSLLLDSGSYAPGVGPIHITDVQCNGTEYRILDCLYRSDTHDLLHSVGDVGIVCQPGKNWHCLSTWYMPCFSSPLYSLQSVSCQDGEVKLVEGETEWKGRLEVCLGRRWGTVSNDGWSVANAEVVCRDLGYEINTTGL